MNNANQDNLWDQLTIQGKKDNKLDSNLDIKTIMDSWTLKKGYPVINIKRLDFENSSEATSTLLILKQSWFLLNPLSKVYKQKELYHIFKWFVPFTFTRKSELNFAFESKPYWLTPNQTESKKASFAKFQYLLAK